MMERDALFEAVRKILMRDWDPIGINDVPAAQDEYDAYASNVVQMLRRDASVDVLYLFLRQIETDHMGLTGDRETTRHVAEKLWLC